MPQQVEPAASENCLDTEASVHDFIERFGIDIVNQFQDEPPDDSTVVSGATYEAVSPQVGLEPYNEAKDMSTFEIHRSRIPTDLLKSIVMDLDVMLRQYGPPAEHQNAAARSSFFSPVFNHLVKQFGSMLRNQPEKFFPDYISTGAYIKYSFKAFGAIVILCIEMEFLKLSDAGHLDAIAKIITECHAYDLDNTKYGFALPIYCILSDGVYFEFFKFERTNKSRFLRGCIAGNTEHFSLELPDLPRSDSEESTLPFIVKLRHICETIFDVMLSGYISGLKAHSMASKGGTNGDAWDQALDLAEKALEKFRDAEKLRQGGDGHSADTRMQEAFSNLKESTESVPSKYRPKRINWDYDWET